MVLGKGPLAHAQGLVLDFHRKFGCFVQSRPAWSGAQGGGGSKLDSTGDQLRVDLVKEEAEELEDAVKAGDFPGAIDALADLIYVCLGAAVSWGVDLSPIFEEVHAANMRKEGGATRADGKILKPAGWVGPDNEARLLAQGWNPGASALPVAHDRRAVDAEFRRIGGETK